VKARIAAVAPFPPNVRAFTTLRYGAGVSQAPFDTFNLGNFRDAAGDDPAAVARNRAELVARFGLPSTPHWLRQVHGTRVLRFDAPASPPPQPSPASGGGSLKATAFLPSSPLAEQGRDLGRSSGDVPPLPSPHAAEGRGEGQHHRRASLRAPSLAEQGRDLGRSSGDASPLPSPRAGEGRGGGLADDAAHATSSHPLPGVGPDPGGAEPEADAAVTSVPGVVLAILTADCLPVVFAARDGSEVAAAHAGWPGLSQGMLEATLAAMRAPADALVAWIGPCAGPAHYEVGRNVFDAFVERDPGAAAAFAPTRPGHWLADLPALARRRLVAAGMPAAAIHGGELCTISDPARLFSHRRDGRSGRIATLAWIDPA